MKKNIILKEENKNTKPSIDMPWLKYYDADAFEKARNIPNNMTLWDFIEKKLIEDKNVPALEYFKKEISRPDFIDSVYIWARTLRAMGVEEDEIVPIYGPFFPDICAITFALNMIGAKSYFLKLAISKEALIEETIEAKIAIVYDGMWNNVKDVFGDDKFKKIIVASAADSMTHPKKEIVTFVNYIKAKKNSSSIPIDSKYVWIDDVKKIANYYTGNVKVDFKPNREAFITSSSGTTVGGVVKGTCATNEAAITQLLQASNAGINYNYGAKCLTNLPPTASTSLNCLFFLPLYRGMTVINEPRLSESTFYNQIMEYKPQVALMTGSFWEAFFRNVELNVKKGKKIDLSFFDMPIVGGEGMNPQELKWMNELLEKNGSNVPLFNGYGLSEVFSVATVDKLGKEFNDIKRDKKVIGVGIPFPGVEAGIFDDNGKELGYNERGELWLKTPSVMARYYNKPELTEKTKVNGWIKTGDIFEMDENGILYMWGRKKDKINLDDKEIQLFDIAYKIRENVNIKNVFVNAMPLEDNSVGLVAHIVFEDDFIGSKEEVYANIDKELIDFLPKGIEIVGYKSHPITFKSSPTTAKKDRNGLMKELDGYVKVQDDGVFDVKFVDGDNHSTYKVETVIRKKDNQKILKR